MTHFLQQWSPFSAVPSFSHVPLCFSFPHFSSTFSFLWPFSLFHTNSLSLIPPLWSNPPLNKHVFSTVLTHAQVPFICCYFLHFRSFLKKNFPTRAHVFPHIYPDCCSQQALYLCKMTLVMGWAIPKHAARHAAENREGRNTRMLFFPLLT